MSTNANQESPPDRVRDGEVSGATRFERTLAMARSAAAGDEAAIESLFRTFYPTVYRIVEIRAGRRLLAEMEFEDMVQEALLEAIRGFDRFELRSMGAFHNWLARIVENNVIDARRRQNAVKRQLHGLLRHADFSASSITDSLFGRTESTPSQFAGQREMEERLREALATQLRGPYREVVVLRSLCEMPFREVAETMGYSKTSTVRAMHTRALQELRRLMAE